MNCTRMQRILRAESMSWLAIIAVCSLLTGCTSPPDHSLRHKAIKPYDPTIPESPPGCIGMIVSFAGSEWMDADELKHKAKQKLREEGHQVDDSHDCCINVELIGKGAGCTVEFSKGFGKRMYFVDFDRKGKIQKVRTGIMVEKLGSPP
jgi:hypothetical protein